MSNLNGPLSPPCGPSPGSLKSLRVVLNPVPGSIRTKTPLPPNDLSATKICPDDSISTPIGSSIFGVPLASLKSLITLRTPLESTLNNRPLPSPAALSGTMKSPDASISISSGSTPSGITPSPKLLIRVGTAPRVGVTLNSIPLEPVPPPAPEIITSPDASNAIP